MEEITSEILIVDDNLDVLRFLSTVLDTSGYNVRVVKNGEQALASIDISEPDLILLDVHMPEMSGFEVCRIIKKDPKYKNIPIILLTALSDSFNKILGFQAGAVDYMTKPLDVDEVKERIKIHLKLSSSVAELDRLKEELELKDKEIELLKARLGDL